MPVPNATRTLAGIDIFKEMTPETIAEADRLVRWRSVAADHVLVEHEDTTRDLYVVSRGLLKVTSFSAGGREVEYRNVGPGTSFGELAAIDGKPRSASVVALEASEIGVISAADFHGLMARHPELAFAVMRKLAAMIRSLTQKVFEFTTENVRSRVIHELVRLGQEVTADGRSATLRPPPKQVAIAARCNTHREAVSRTFADLTKRGLLRRVSGTLQIADLSRLRAQADGEM
jgi:CRP-like cAMP-binding protein